MNGLHKIMLLQLAIDQPIPIKLHIEIKDYKTIKTYWKEVHLTAFHAKSSFIAEQEMLRGKEIHRPSWCALL